MKRHISFPSIDQYCTTIKNLVHHFRYIGKDENGDPIYDNVKELPILTFTGTEKLHGTNSSFCYDIDTEEEWIQSRQRIITPVSDNAGFAFFVEGHKDCFHNMLNDIITENNLKNGTICIFGEFCGANIQKGVALQHLPKMFVIFDIKHVDQDENVSWLDYYCEPDSDNSIYHVNNFSKWSVDVDLNNPKLIQNTLIDITMDIEKESHVGKYFGITLESEGKTTIGEGIIWRCKLNDGSVARVKIKGEKHQNSKVKTLANVDTEKLESINDFITYACTENRMNQMKTDSSEFVDISDIKNVGFFIRKMSQDILKEEIDAIVNSGLEWKDVARAISKRSSEWFVKSL